MKQLPDANREVIHLFYYEGYPTAQIAKILNRRESTVRSDLRRGRERLKNGTPHSRYFSDELGVPNFLINIEQMFAI